MKSQGILTVVILLLALGSLTPSLEAQEQIVISQVEAPMSAYRLMAIRILEEAYSRLGVELTFKLFPGERALNEANNGNTDGEFTRIAGIAEKYQNLIMIDIPIAYEDIVVLTTNTEFPVMDWESLRSYTIGFLRGFKLGEKRTQGMKVEMVTSVEQALKKLATGRTDVVVELRSSLCAAQKMGLSEVKALEPALEQLVQYHYLHKRHESLAMRLEGGLRQMEEEGTLESIQQDAVQEFFAACQ